MNSWHHSGQRQQTYRRLCSIRPGGAVVAISMAREIRRRGLITYVGRHSQCVSACTLIFQGGAVRAVHPSAFLAYHTPKVVGPDGPSGRVLARTRVSFRAL